MRSAADRIAIRLQELAIGRETNSQQEQDSVRTNEFTTSGDSSAYTHFSYHHLPNEIHI